MRQRSLGVKARLFGRDPRGRRGRFGGKFRERERLVRRFDSCRVNVFGRFGRDRLAGRRRDFRLPVRSERRPKRKLKIAVEFEFFRLNRFAGIDQRFVKRRFV